MDRVHGGAVCRACGHVYSNPRPSAKLRRAHKRSCRAPEGMDGDFENEREEKLDSASCEESDLLVPTLDSELLAEPKDPSTDIGGTVEENLNDLAIKGKTNLCSLEVKSEDLKKCSDPLINNADDMKGNNHEESKSGEIENTQFDSLIGRPTENEHENPKDESDHKVEMFPILADKAQSFREISVVSSPSSKHDSPEGHPARDIISFSELQEQLDCSGQLHHMNAEWKHACQEQVDSYASTATTHQTAKPEDSEFVNHCGAETICGSVYAHSEVSPKEKQIDQQFVLGSHPMGSMNLLHADRTLAFTTTTAGVGPNEAAEESKQNQEGADMLLSQAEESNSTAAHAALVEANTPMVEVGEFVRRPFDSTALDKYNEGINHVTSPLDTGCSSEDPDKNICGNDQKCVELNDNGNIAACVEKEKNTAEAEQAIPQAGVSDIKIGELPKLLSAESLEIGQGNTQSENKTDPAFTSVVSAEALDQPKNVGRSDPLIPGESAGASKMTSVGDELPDTGSICAASPCQQIPSDASVAQSINSCNAAGIYSEENEVENANHTGEPGCEIQVERNTGEKEEINSVVSRANSDASHVSLKVLLAKASNDSKSRSSSERMWSSFRSRGSSKDDSVSSKLCSPKLSLCHEAWNSPAKLPHPNGTGSRKARGKQAWVPFICCRSMY